MKLRRLRGRRRGFTLLELAVSTVIAASLLFVCSRVFSVALTGRERLRETTGDLTALRRAYDVIARDMHSGIVPPDDSGLDFGLTSSGGSIGSNVLQFAAVDGDPLLAGRAANETSLIQYAIAEDPRTERPTLWRYETPYPVPEGNNGAATTGQDARALPLLPGVTAANYLFYSQADQNWIESWEDQAGLPSAIRIDLAFGENREHPRQQSWVFHLPAARFANDEAEEAAAAESGSGAAGGTR